MCSFTSICYISFTVQHSNVICQNTGWSTLQIQLLQELVVAAKRMGNAALATRHTTFLLQTMWDHLNLNDRKEFAIQLQVNTYMHALLQYEDMLMYISNV